MMLASGCTLVDQTTNCSIHRNSWPYGTGASVHILSAPELEVVGQRRDAVFVRVEALHHEAALADVGVDVTAEQRDGEHQRQAPRHDRLQRGLAGPGAPDPDALAQPQPGADQEHAADGQQDDAQADADGFGAHPDEQRNPAEFGDRGEPADAERTDRHEHRPDEPGQHGGPGVVHVGRHRAAGDVPAAVFPAAGTGAVISGSSNLLWGTFPPAAGRVVRPGARRDERKTSTAAYPKS